MTPTQIEEAARRRYNAVNDTFWSQDEIFQLIFDACQQMARECKIIERSYSTTTVSSQQEYDFPTDTISIKRVTWNGIKLKPITMREDDGVTGLNMTTTATGTPQYYWIWNYTISLRPIPNDAQTLKIWSYNQPSTLTSTSTIEIPSEFHMELVNYVVQSMAEKDSNFKAAQYYALKWQKALMDAKRWVAKRKRSDSFPTVQDEEQLVESYLGTV